jgi:hypothetical protein
VPPVARSLCRFLFALPALAAAAPACTDPVRDAEIAALGGEEQGVPIGAEHRPGQPCLHCHVEGGPASGSPFAVAGTVYRTEAHDAPPAEGISVQFVDANNGAPRIIPVTNAAGNFFVRSEEWPDIAFPLRVGLYQDPNAAPVQTMRSLVNREGSCNQCHRRNPNPRAELTPEELDDSRRSAGQIYVTAGASAPAGAGK